MQRQHLAVLLELLLNRIALSCVFAPVGIPVVDTEASILVTEITGQETNVVCAETVVVPPPDELKGHRYIVRLVLLLFFFFFDAAAPTFSHV